MKPSIIFLLSVVLGLTGCVNLDLNPLSQSSTGNFYTNQAELELAVNDLYRSGFYDNDPDRYTDSHWDRGALGNPITFGTLNADDANVLSYWVTAYQQIARVNSFLANRDRAKANTPVAIFTRLEAEARFFRAFQYGRLITHFGDVPLLKEAIDLNVSYQLGRSSKDEVLQFVFSELDWAANNLPVSYSSGELKRITKGVALGAKARIALYMNKWDVARSAAKAVMDLGVYSLHKNYAELFLKAGQTSPEIIFSLPQGQEFGAVISADPLVVQQYFNRLNGGTAAQIPSWEIIDSYECTDGLPIDESPLYNPKQPFKNRDPRMTMSIVEFGTPWLGFTFQPHPDSLQVRNYKTGAMVSNLDTRAVQNFASWTGFLWKKGIEQYWVDRRVMDTDIIIQRYAEILLMYAEANIELNTIDQSVLDAINQIRARAYGVTPGQTNYPAIRTLNQKQLRTILKRERRVELAREGLRYMDLIRWQIAEKALSKPVIGFPDPANQDRTKWPFAGTPAIDDDGIPDYTALMPFVKVLANRSFDKSKQYLWPIPAVERRINPLLTQNSGY
ncbi:RagB/SusD family nutrient uptake outer membrane protein [Spirosoma daeguense]